MRILSLDPGITTGIAVYNDDGNLECSMAVTLKGLYRNGFFSYLISISKPDITLVESLPTNHVDPDTLRVYSYITQWLNIASYPFETIKPAQWKGLVARVEIPGQHARDAATMAKWWLVQKKLLTTVTNKE